jgi:hypothetical protein
MLRGAKIDAAGPLTAIFAPDLGEQFGEGVITIPAYEAYNGTLRTPVTAWTTANLQEAFRPVGKKMAYEKFRRMHDRIQVK